MPSVLFVCTANQFRSPIAAACLREQLARENLENEWRVESAGTWGVSGLARPPWRQPMAPGGHRSRQMLLEGFDLVLGHKEAICAEFPSVCRPPAPEPWTDTIPGQPRRGPSRPARSSST
jgi:protein-tyrosine phosphatase